MDEELGNKDTEEDYIYCTLLWREKIRINSRNHRKADSGSESKKKKDFIIISARKYVLRGYKTYFLRLPDMVGQNLIETLKEIFIWDKREKDFDLRPPLSFDFYYSLSLVDNFPYEDQETGSNRKQKEKHCRA